MFEPTSRYAGIEDATLVVGERLVRYRRRRFVPEPGGEVVAEVVVAPGDRLDLLAAQHLGDPTAYWKLCDAAGVLDPAELEETGTVVLVRLEVPR
jgi:hypothetical protein